AERRLGERDHDVDFVRLFFLRDAPAAARLKRDAARYSKANVRIGIDEQVAAFYQLIEICAGFGQVCGRLGKFHDWQTTLLQPLRDGQHLVWVKFDFAKLELAGHLEQGFFYRRLEVEWIILRWLEDPVRDEPDALRGIIPGAGHDRSAVALHAGINANPYWHARLSQPRSELCIGAGVPQRHIDERRFARDPAVLNHSEVLVRRETLPRLLDPFLITPRRHLRVRPEHEQSGLPIKCRRDLLPSKPALVETLEQVRLAPEARVGHCESDAYLARRDRNHLRP